MRIMSPPVRLNFIQTEVMYFPNFINPHSSHLLYEYFLQNVEWENEHVRIGGKTILAPRQVAYYGDVHYAYAGTFHRAKPFEHHLLSLKENVERYTKYQFNSALLNYYKDGTSSLGWHSDDEKSLGPSPAVASVSLGGQRKFQFKHKITKETFSFVLESGSLLLMEPGTQETYLHQVPKVKKAEPRINITFRYIYE